MFCCTKIFLIFIFLFLKKANSIKKDSITNESLPICLYIDPVKEMIKWDAFNFSTCKIKSFHPPNDTDIYENVYKKGKTNYGYNLYGSNMIGARRDLSHIITHERCSNVLHEIGNLKANIIIIYHNEAFSVLVRMINSIIANTPDNILRQIILYDDFSDEDLKINDLLYEYIAIKKEEKGYKNEKEKKVWTTKVKIHQAKKREGLIRAKVYASRLINKKINIKLKNTENNDVIVFLDSHCEVTKNWIQPLLSPIYKNPKVVVAPIVDIINPIELDYTKAMIARGTFDWHLKFKWEYFPWSYFDDVNNYVEPFKTVAPSGGLIAIKEDYFREIGEYDMGMEIWGAENVELSIKVWSCGGLILTAPCSRVGHIFRVVRPYSSKPGVNTNLYNSLRVVNVWFDEYKEKFFLYRPTAKQIDAGNLTDQIALKKKLNCKPFKWFLENVHQDLLAHDVKKKTVKTEL